MGTTQEHVAPNPQVYLRNSPIVVTQNNNIIFGERQVSVFLSIVSYRSVEARCNDPWRDAHFPIVADCGLNLQPNPNSDTISVHVDLARCTRRLGLVKKLQRAA